MNRCKFNQGQFNCGSYAFNLYKEGIAQGVYCDHHYWQDQAMKARADEREALAEQPAQPAINKMAEDERQEPVGRTDRQIVDETEKLAAWLLSWSFNHQSESKTPMRESTHPFAESCWAAACHIQEMLTATDPENAVAELEGDAGEEAAPQPAPAPGYCPHCKQYSIEEPLPAAHQEPVAWQFYQDGKWHNGMETSSHRANTEAAGVPVRDVYPSPPAQQEPVAWLRKSDLVELRACNYMRLGADSPSIWAPNAPDEPSPNMELVAVYTFPPPRKPLTDAEIDGCWNKDLWKNQQPHRIFARAIEAKLKEKNT